MGRFRYGPETFPMDDRLMIHLQVALHEMFVHRQSFYLTWIRPVSQGSGRVSVLMTPGTHVLFEYDGNRVPAINGAWIEHLVEVGLRGTGLVLLPEPPGRGTA